MVYVYSLIFLPIFQKLRLHFLVCIDWLLFVQAKLNKTIEAKTELSTSDCNNFKSITVKFSLQSSKFIFLLK